jgi:hypothetical protein
MESDRLLNGRGVADFHLLGLPATGGRKHLAT